jgi:hypothetical protein
MQVVDSDKHTSLLHPAINDYDREFYRSSFLNQSYLFYLRCKLAYFSKLDCFSIISINFHGYETIKPIFLY